TGFVFYDRPLWPARCGSNTTVLSTTSLPGAMSKSRSSKTPPPGIFFLARLFTSTSAFTGSATPIVVPFGVMSLLLTIQAAATGSGLSIDLFAIRLLDSLHGAHGKGMEANLYL